MSTRQHGEECTRRCVTNLCSHPDIGLINALLDDDQLLADFQYDHESTFSSIVKAFRQLHSQLKNELSCALNGEINNEIPLRLLSILEDKQQQNEQNPSEGLPFVDGEKHPFELPTTEEIPVFSEEKILDGQAESTEVISLKKKERNGEQWTSDHQVKTDDDCETIRRGVLELQFIHAFSIGVARSGDDKFVDCSVQVESDLDFGDSSHTEKLKADKENTEESLRKSAQLGKEDEDFVESVSASSVHNSKESSFSTTTANSTNSTTELSVGEVDRRRVTRLLAMRNDTKVYDVNAEGAFLTCLGKRERHMGRKKRRSAASTNRVEDENLVEVLSAKMIALGGGVGHPRQQQRASQEANKAKLQNALNEESGEGEEQGQKRATNRLKQGKGQSEDHEEREEGQSTLDQVTPIPTAFESNSSN